MLDYPIINKRTLMLIDKYIKEATTESELYGYKMTLSCQIIESKNSLNMIEIKLKKIKLKENKIKAVQ